MSYLTDNIRVKWAADSNGDLIDLTCGNSSAISVELAIQRMQSDPVWQQIAEGSGENIAECLIERQRMSDLTLVRGARYQPHPRHETTARLLSIDGYQYVNTYHKPKWIMEDGNIQPFFSLMCRLFPNKTDREQMYSWLAMLAHHPERKSYGIILKGGQGSGKSTILRIMEKLVGVENAFITSNMKCVSGGFNSIWMDSVLVGLEEVKSISNAGSFYNALKTFVSDIRQAGERKGKDIERFDCFSKVVVCTNAEVPFPLEEDDRRFAVYSIEHKFDQEETNNFIAMHIDEVVENIGAIAKWLKTRIPAEWSVNAPASEAKAEVVEQSLPEWQVMLRDYISSKEVVTLEEASSVSKAYVQAIKPATVGAFIKKEGWLNRRVRWAGDRTQIYYKPLHENTSTKDLLKIMQES